MLDTTSYADKLPPSLNGVIKDFIGGECVMVRKAKEREKLTGKSGFCHDNVELVISKFGGTSVGGWLLSRRPEIIENGMYVWSFHSVWMKEDGKLLDVTDDKNYAGRDKSIFVPDSTRVPNLVEGIFYNNFVVFTERNFTLYYAQLIGRELKIDTPYWTDNSLHYLIEIDQHSGEYRRVSSKYSTNRTKMCDEYEIDLIEGKLIPRPGSKYENDSLPIRFLFDYSAGISF